MNMRLLPFCTTDPCGDFATPVSEMQQVSDKLNIKHVLALVKQFVANLDHITVTVVTGDVPPNGRAGDTLRKLSGKLARLHRVDAGCVVRGAPGNGQEG